MSFGSVCVHSQIGGDGGKAVVSDNWERFSATIELEVAG